MLCDQSSQQPNHVATCIRTCDERPPVLCDQSSQQPNHVATCISTCDERPPVLCDQSSQQPNHVATCIRTCDERPPGYKDRLSVQQGMATKRLTQVLPPRSQSQPAAKSRAEPTSCDASRSVFIVRLSSKATSWLKCDDLKWCVYSTLRPSLHRDCNTQRKKTCIVNSR